jgi:glycosyltransferase involved in cell wall biosynthesis
MKVSNESSAAPVAPEEAMISLVICTRDRADKLAMMLESLNSINDIARCEVVIVDNNSTDSTPDVIEQYRVTSNSRGTQHLFESARGTGFAKNLGWRAARGNIVVFTDDDCYPEKNFLRHMKACFDEDSSLGYVGGRALLHDPTDMKVTLKEQTERLVVDAGQLVEPGFIVGANFAFRRAALIEADGFDNDFGAGTPFSCEDLDLLTRVSLNGWRGVYDPRPVVYHAHGRKAVPQVRRLMHQYDHGRGAYFSKLLLLPRVRVKCAEHWFHRIRQQRIGVTLREMGGAISYVGSRLSRRYGQR